jgi:hypothetical protein
VVRVVPIGFKKNIDSEVSRSDTQLPLLEMTLEKGINPGNEASL